MRGTEPRNLQDTAEVDWVAAMARVDECDGYALLVSDPQTDAIDTYGPYDGLGAVTAADDLRSSLDAEGLEDVVVRVVRMHLATGGRRPHGAAG